jgi:hypothetical protein
MLSHGPDPHGGDLSPLPAGTTCRSTAPWLNARRRTPRKDISRLQATPPTARRVPTTLFVPFGRQESAVDHHGTALLSELKYTLRPVAAALGHAWVASRAGVSRRAVSAWLCDERRGSLLFAERVARACGYAIVVTPVRTSDYAVRLRMMDPGQRPRRLRATTPRPTPTSANSNPRPAPALPPRR